MKAIIWNDPALREDAVRRISERVKTIVDADTGVGLVLAATKSLREAFLNEAGALADVWLSLNLADPIAVDAYRSREYLQELRRRRINENPDLPAAMEELTSALLQSEPLLRELAESSSVAEGSLAALFWKERILNMEVIAPANRVRVLREIAQEITSNLRQLAQGPTEHLPTQAEKLRLRGLASWSIK